MGFILDDDHRLTWGFPSAENSCHPYNPPTVFLRAQRTSKMISDDTLYKIANYLGSMAVLFIILYHWIEVNAKGNEKVATVTPAGKSAAALK